MTESPTRPWAAAPPTAQIAGGTDDTRTASLFSTAGRTSMGVTLRTGDARGHWEGNTLVIDTTNMNGKGRLSVVGDFLSERAHVTERLTFVDADTMNYEVTIDDPTVFTRPWTMRAAKKRKPDYEFWENACHEGEKSAEHMLQTDQDRNQR